MNLRNSINTVSRFLKLLGLLMIFPSVCSIVYKEDDVYAFIVSGIFTFFVGFVVENLTKTESIKEIERKDGFFIASFCWISAVVFGALPYLIYGVFNNPIDAFFESTAGFTTTGATTVVNIEILPHGILFWRSFTQWIGGMGILILAIAILPKLSIGGMQLMALEAPGHTTEKFTPRIAETAKRLWVIYFILSIILLILLNIFGMSFFDSLIQVFSTLSIGGFSNKNLNVEAHDSVLIESTITAFMFIAGINFALLYWCARRKFSKLISNPEFKFYCSLLIIAIMLVSLDLYVVHTYNFLDALRYSSFNVTSIMTTTGFSSIDFDKWPEFSKWLLVILMFIGGCSGSTSGSVKILRIMILLKHALRVIKKNIYPNAVLPIRFGNDVLDEGIISGVINFFLIYIFVFVISTILFSFDNVPVMTALTACAASLGNVGPGLELVGPANNYSSISNLSKTVLIILMLMGRLELFAILVIFTPSFWKK
jgi:trk system potassium uptake protein